MFRECFALHVKENVQLLQMINGLIRVVIGGWLLGNQHHIFYLPGHIVCQFVPLLNIAKFNQS